MSGGSWEYLYLRIEDAAGGLSTEGQSPLRRAFGAHLALVAAAMHDIEWVDSCDYGKGDEEAAIRAALGEAADLKALSVAITHAKLIAHELDGLIQAAERSVK